jgi:hypothetical protein
MGCCPVACGTATYTWNVRNQLGERKGGRKSVRTGEPHKQLFPTPFSPPGKRKFKSAKTVGRWLYSRQME